MKKIIFIVFVLFTNILLVKASDWVYTGDVFQPGLTPSVSVASPNVVWIVGGGPSAPKIFKTTDGGLNWIQCPTTGIQYLVNCVGAVTDMTAFVGEGEVNGFARVFKTTNGGDTWTQVFQTSANGGNFTGIAFTKSRQNLFGLAIAERIYRTSDAGQNWVELSAGVVGVSNAHNSLMITDNNFYGFGLNNGAPRIRLTTNNAASWVTQVISVTGNYTSAIAFHTNKLNGIAATSSSLPEISRTTDGGLTWTNVDAGAGMSGVCYTVWVPEGPVIYIMSENGVIKRSTDNGISWVVTPTPVNDLKHFDFVQLNNVVYGYAVSSNGKVIKLVDTLSILTGGINSSIPKEFSLSQNYPNPFNPTSIIDYSVAKESFVKLYIYDALGREISVLVNEVKTPGKYSVSVDGTVLNSGVYFYKLTAGDFTQTRKMILLK